MKNIFVDGSNGTAGMLLMQKLACLQQQYKFNVISLDENNYKNESARYEAIKNAHIAILCVPEQTATKTMIDLKEVNTTIIDVSSAHRTNIDWQYGFPELNSQQKELIKKSTRIANPGCFAMGMISLLNPLVKYLNPTYPLIINGFTGYSAGGKKGMDKYLENPVTFRATNLNKVHPHIPEVLHITQLTNQIMFNPCVAGFKNGQMVQITLFNSHLHTIALDSVKEIFKNYYSNSNIIHIKQETPNFINPEEMKNSDEMNIYVNSIESGDYIQLVATYDNLGKGAAGSIIQNLELLLS